ncbi:hypothetical protein ACEZDB_10745 [Streptacidiphilus sp. N1-3]|uniref:Uncharacterized protein n=1 Tax=Streptacidiphilus alkalitolerans TaxID=3342712 RepID=A0ABV6WYK9_9ACTN
MSVIVEFFVAPDEASAVVALSHGPHTSLPTLSCRNFDPEEALIEWECLLAGVTFEELVVAGENAESDVVFALSDLAVLAKSAVQQSTSLYGLVA